MNGESNAMCGLPGWVYFGLKISGFAASCVSSHWGSLVLLGVVEVDHPIDAKFVLQHPKIRTPKSIGDGHGNLPPYGKRAENTVRFGLGLGKYRYGHMLADGNGSHPGVSIAAHEYRFFADG